MQVFNGTLGASLPTSSFRYQYEENVNCWMQLSYKRKSVRLLQGYRMKVWGKTDAFWGGLWGFIVSSAFFGFPVFLLLESIVTLVRGGACGEMRHLVK